jgi:uncharacterized repeat protein (TIGR01451 family)
MHCSLGTIQPGASATIRIVLKPRDTGCKQRNAASATGAGTDSNPADNLDTVNVCATQPKKPVLAVTKVASTDTARPTSVVGYTITVRNKGKGEARNVKVCDRPPSALRILSSQPRARKQSAPCWHVKRLAAGAKRAFRVTAQVADSATGVQRNVATVGAANVKGVRADAASVRVKPLPQTPCGSRLVRPGPLFGIGFRC